MWQSKRVTTLYLLFFCSGFPALFYQIAWQRSLVAIYGFNIESVSIVVAACMLGLGLGSLLGGWLSKSWLRHSLRLFGLFECGIGLFGLVSLHLFEWVGNLTLHISYTQLTTTSFFLICIPTLMMGATLPLLVATVIREFPNVGRSVGILYCVNTLGGAVACLLVALWAMHHLGLSGTVILGAVINFIIGILALSVNRIQRPRQYALDLAIEEEALSYRKMIVLKLPIALIFAFVTGFIALSYEVLLIRIYGFASGGLSTTFAMVLGFYLLGLASGALLSRLYCNNWREKSTLSVLAATLLASTLVGYLYIPLLANSIRVIPLFATFSWISLFACLLGFSLPLISHSAIRPDQKVGSQLSFLYFSNILGSTLGSLLTGFILLEYWSLGKITLGLSFIGLFLCVGILIIQKSRGWANIVSLGCLAAVFSVANPLLYQHVYEKLFYKSTYQPDKVFFTTIENRNGIITVQPDGTVFGGGVYDGRFNISLMHDTNSIARAYAISAFDPNPAQVLMVGLASGSWAQVIAHHPRVKKLTIIEINPGYLQLIAHHAEVSSLLKNPKVEIIIADGRRWIKQNSLQRFDLVVMNTTFHWREHAANLLSVDFFKTVQTILKPKGILYFNTTDSPEALHTAASVFPYALRIRNFVAVSRAPIRINKARWADLLQRYHIDGRPVFNLDNERQQKRFNEVLSWADTVNIHPSKPVDMEYRRDFLPRVKKFRLITDDNMATEW